MPRTTLVAALALTYAPCTASSAATPIFLMDNRPGVSNTIFRVAPATGQLTQVGTIPLTFGDALGLAAESHNVLYVTTVDAPAAHRLLRVTVTPFTIVELGALRGFYQGLVWSNSGSTASTRARAAVACPARPLKPRCVP